MNKRADDTTRKYIRHYENLRKIASNSSGSGKKHKKEAKPTITQKSRKEKVDA